MYYSVKHTAKIDIGTLIESYTEADMFENCCKECPNYGKIYACPPYGFDRMDFLRQFSQLELVALQLIFDRKLAGKIYSKQEIKLIYDNILAPERRAFDAALLDAEKSSGGTALYAGSCTLCGKKECARVKNQPCLNPDKMRYSIESLGGNVVTLARDYLGVEILWVKDGKLPEYLLQVGGILTK